jgi:hypothetical protein
MRFENTDMQWIKTELGGLYGSEILKDLDKLVKLYELYDGPGQHWMTEDEETAGYKPTQLVTNYIKMLVKAESRFMAGRAPEIRIDADANDKEAAEQMEKFLASTLAKNRWQKKLLHGVRDCFIGKRVALCLDGAPGAPIGIRFVPSLEFAYEADDTGNVSKIIFFYGVNDLADKSKQRISRKKLWMEGGRCYLDEGVYDGYGRLVESKSAKVDTGLMFVPVYVIVNDGLTGDAIGESDVRELMGNQKAYNYLKSDDMDALKFNMFPQKVFTDASQASMDKVVVAPGAMIDLQTDPARVGQSKADAKVLETAFSYDNRYEHAIERIEADMYALVSVPNVGTEELKGFATSGKAMRALYWNLICRCEEKWAEWDDALKWMARKIFEMARLFGGETLPEIEYSVRVVHLYPIPDEEEDERMRDLSEVSQGTRSRLTYVTKWQPGADAQGELKQIQAEQRAQDAYGMALAAELGNRAEV